MVISCINMAIRGFEQEGGTASRRGGAKQAGGGEKGAQSDLT